VDAASTSYYQGVARAHAALAELVTPAMPRAIALIYREQKTHPMLCLLGPIPTVRRLLMLALFSIITMLLIALLPNVNAGTLSKDLLDSSGWELFICEMFLLTASTVGSSFVALFHVHEFVARGTYDPRQRSTYMLQVVLGLISGILLSEILGSYIMKASRPEGAIPFERSLLALVGGFSSSLVYRILHRILVAIESLFGEDSSNRSTVINRRTTSSYDMDTSPDDGAVPQPARPQEDIF
jgi:hypothetical protein